MTTDKINIYKLASGEEIVGKVIADTANILILRSPLRVDRIFSDGSMFYTTRAWFMAQFEGHEERDIELKQNAIIGVMEPGAEVIKQYESTIEYLLAPENHDEAVFEDPTDSDGGKLLQFPGSNSIN